ncbi:MAG: universal stress protein [Bacteroidales bacterium]|jgi:nucleotide-binding universal stress UspA family protein|nr:universal stress protein [Bacteroidales bacterium]
MAKQLNDIILVPTDFSETCQNAINYGVELAEYLDYNLLILHVINRESKSQLKKDKEEVSSITNKLKAIANDIMEKSRITVETLTKEGSIFDEIHGTAEDIGAKLMVLGTHGKKGLQYLVGSHALKVVTKAPVPTIVVQKGSIKKGFKNIVFPINTFTEARQQVQWAIHMAKTFDSCINIFREKHTVVTLDGKINIVSEQIKKAFNKYGIKYKITDAEKGGRFAEQMLNHATAEKADMIMIMTDADIFSPNFNAEAWDEKVMFNKAEIPVMCINPVMTGKVYYEYITLL